MSMCHVVEMFDFTARHRQLLVHSMLWPLTAMTYDFVSVMDYFKLVS